MIIAYDGQEVLFLHLQFLETLYVLFYILENG